PPAPDCSKIGRCSARPGSCCRRRSPTHGQARETRIMSDASYLSRRAFVRTGLAGAAALLGNALPLRAADAKLPQRVFGKTGVRVPILGLGTVAVGNVEDTKKAVGLIHKAIDLGVTYIDTAPPRTRIALFTGYSRAQSYLNGVLKERRKEV